MLSELLAKHQQWRDRRFLKKHRCETWDQYHHFYDPDFNICASRITDYYHGYHHWYMFEDHKHYCYKCLSDYGPGGTRYGYEDIHAWCKQNLTHKFRLDALRVIRAASTANQWTINEIGGTDYIFMAFKDQQEFTWFMLRWG